MNESQESKEKQVKTASEESKAIIKEELDLALEECGGTLNRKKKSGVIDLRENREEEIRARNSGKANISRQRPVRPARSMKNLCVNTAKNPCDLICGKKLISEKDRQCIYQYFWNLPNRTQRYEYIARHVRLMESKKRKTDHISTKARCNTQLYFLKIDGKLRRVCATTFLAILDINGSWIVMSIKKFGHLSVVKLFDSEVPPPLIPIRSKPVNQDLQLISAGENNAQVKKIFFINNLQVPPLVPIRPVTNLNLISANENNIQMKTKLLAVNPNSIDNTENDSEAEKKNEMKRQQAILAGMPYVKCDGSKHPGRSVKKGCNSDCLFNCHTITEEQRQKIFRDFWSINDRFGKYEFISRLIEQKESKGRTGNYSRRRRRRKYFFEIDGQFKRVCHLMFVATLDISLFWVGTAVKHLGPRAVVSVNDVEDKDIDPIL